MKRLALAVLVVLCPFLNGCDGLDPFETLGPSEHGVVFSALPPFLGGGVGEKVYSPKQKVFVWAWEELYRFDTGLQTLSWGGRGEGDKSDVDDYVQTRASDGNEVLLSMTVTYRVVPEKLKHVIERVGVSPDVIRQVVTAVARTDIRMHMNYLRTEDVQVFEERQKRVDQVQDFMNARLRPEGIEIVDVIFEKGLFYRELADGTLDTSYQDQINETEQTNQKTEQERNRSKTVEAEMKQKFAEAEGASFKVREQADGILRQADGRATAKYEALVTDAERVHAVGLSEIEGMKKELEALGGPGGKALLRKEIAQALIERDPKFVVVNQPPGGQGVGVNRLDTNELVQQLGVLGGLQEGKRSGPPEAIPVPLTPTPR